MAEPAGLSLTTKPSMKPEAFDAWKGLAVGKSVELV